METGEISDDYHYKIVRLQRENAELKKQLSEANYRIGDLMARDPIEKAIELQSECARLEVVNEGFQKQLTTAREIAGILTQLLHAGNTQRAKELAEKLCEVLGENT